MKVLLLLPILALVAANPVSTDSEDPGEPQETDSKLALAMMMRVINRETQNLYKWLVQQQSAKPRVREVVEDKPEVSRKVICFHNKGCVNVIDP
ncbi:hypothetical protein Zmor_008346 [Zophobas morio]|uniref:Uncharacterized protein n=1 Tax=Zophobas morio TaxID=2755281 RepID=A0AA38IWC4_9CUCU|nr:hypothetical protein Zmor_008346 [Zophobas morio]